MLGVDAHGGESGEHTASTATDRGSQNTFEPKFKSIHKLSHRDEGLFVERGDGVVELVERPIFVAAVLVCFPAVQTGALRCSRKLARPLDGAGDMLGNRWRELHKFAARAFEREAMLVFAARRVRPERGNADAILAFDGLRVPCAGRAVNFRDRKSVDVPAIYRRILW